MAIFKIQGENQSVFDGERFSRKIRYPDYLSASQAERLKPKMVHRFRCLDDDGICYFWGVCSSDSSFVPLDYLGIHYGCTVIEYKNPKTGKYEEL